MKHLFLFPVSLVVWFLMTTASEQNALLPVQPYDQFRTEDCSVRPSTSQDYQNLYTLLCSARSRFQFGVELTPEEHAQVVNSWKTQWTLWLYASNRLPCFFGKLMIIESIQDQSFLGTCSIQQEQHEPVLAVLEKNKKYMNMGMCLSEECKGKHYAAQVTRELTKRIFRADQDVEGVVFSCNNSHPIIQDDNKLTELQSIGFKCEGTVYFPHGLTSLVPQKEAYMLTFLLKRNH